MKNVIYRIHDETQLEHQNGVSFLQVTGKVPNHLVRHYAKRILKQWIEWHDESIHTGEWCIEWHSPYPRICCMTPGATLIRHRKGDVLKFWDEEEESCGQLLLDI